jgi:ferredoxin
MTALDQIGDSLLSSGGIYPRRRVDVSVDRAKCISCGLCVSLAPRMMALDAKGKAYAMCSPVEWSPADGDFVNQCPTAAIVVRPERRKTRRTPGGRARVKAEEG